MTKNLAAILLLATLISACSRKSEKTALEDAGVVFGPTSRDSQLELAPRSSEAMKADLRAEGDLSTADYLRFAEDLKNISESQSSQEIGGLSKKIAEAFYAQPHSTVSLSNSLYLTAIIGEGEPEVQKELSAISKEIKHSIETLTGLLDRSRKSYPWPKSLRNLSAAVSATDDYAVWLVNEIGRQKLDPSIAKPIQAAIKSEYQKYRPRVVKAVDSLQRAKKLGQATQVLKSITREFGFNLGAEGNEQLKKAEKLAASIAGVKTSQNALTLIIDVWRMTAPGDRKAVFKSVPEIYSYLDGKDELSLACLAAPICPNPILMVPKRLVILPKISEFGVENIKNQVDSAARDFLIDEVRSQAVGFLPQIPVMVKGAVLDEAKKYQSLVASVQKDFPGFAKKSFTRWSESNFNSPIRGLEADRLGWKLSSSEEIKLTMKKSTTKGSVESGAETMGLSLATAHEFLPEDKSSKLKAALVSPLLKLLAVSGFRRPGGKIFQSLLYPLDGPREEAFNIKDLLKGKTSFAVPDAFIATEGFAMNRELSAPKASVGAQAELLRGISRQIRFHRDWEKNLFDEKLGIIQVEDVVKEVPRGSVNFSVFPKDVVFALSVGSAGAILQNIILDLSPAFLMLPGEELLWGNDYEKIGEGKISTVAGLVNIENGQRGRTVKTADIARYIVALDEFLNATEGIENTKAAPLLEKNAAGETVVEQLVEARRYLRLFQMGLTNFLVYVAQDKDGGFRSTYTLSLDGTAVKGEGPRLLADQVLAIRALNLSADRLELPLYSWSALDGYYFMNRSLWDKEKQFYSAAVDSAGNRIGNLGVTQIAATLRGIEELTPRMTGEVKSQWQQIAKPWLRALEDF